MQIRNSQSDNPQTVNSLIAQYLARKGYHRSHEIFTNEAAIGQGPELEPLEEIVVDRIAYNNNVTKKHEKHEKLATVKPWRYTSLSRHERDHGTFCLAIQHARLGNENVILTANGKDPLRVLDSKSFSVLAVSEKPPKGALFRVATAIPGTNYVVASGMDGVIHFYIRDKAELRHLKSSKIHTGMIINMIYVSKNENQGYIITAGYDYFVCSTSVTFKAESITADNHTSKTKLLSRPTDITKLPQEPYFAVSRAECTFISILHIDSNSEISQISKISLNDAEFSASAFSPMSMTVYSDSNGTLLTAGTSHIPYMRLITVAIPTLSQEMESVIRGAIVSNVSTFSPQDNYSFPKLAWRPDGAGIWVAGDDGIVRGINFADNEVKVVMSLKAFDKSQERIKSICCFEEEGESTLVVSTNFKKTVFWK